MKDPLMPAPMMAIRYCWLSSRANDDEDNKRRKRECRQLTDGFILQSKCRFRLALRLLISV